MTCDEVRERAGAYVLGALEPAEEAAVREHLAGCDDAHAEIAELGGVVSVLSESVPILDPPAGLKDRIMAAAAADLEERDAAATTTAPTTRAIGPAAAPAAAGRSPDAARAAAAGRFPGDALLAFPTEAQREARRSRAPAGSWILRIAAVLAIVTLGGWNLVLRNDLEATRSYERSVGAVLNVASQPGSTTAILTPAGGTGSGLAAIGADGNVTMAVQDLAPTTGGTVYTAWAINGDGAPASLGDFKVGPNGIATFQGNGAPNVPGLVVALTLEPNPGNQVPLGPTVAKGVATAAT
ncbi:MAG: anti-sigma factor [Chloroflexota bacterium]